MTVEPFSAPHAVLTKELFGSAWSPRRLLRRRPRVIAIFSFRYDAHLVPDLIENLRPIVDGYVAYDDRGAREAYTDERLRKAMLREAAREMGAQWLLCIDPDERLEMATAERIKAMTAVIKPVIWTFRLREMYTPTAYRVDGRWKKKRLGCLFPLLDGQVFGDAPLHSRRNPLNPEYKKHDSGLNLYHLKMIGAERRAARRDFYRALDPESAFQKIGYDYLGDETGLILEEVPASRLYRPLYRETGATWQPDLAAIQPIAETTLRETSANTPGQAKERSQPKPAAATPVQKRRPNSLLRRVARNALGAVVRAFPDTADRAALFALSQLAGRPFKDSARLARLRDLVSRRTPPESKRTGRQERQAKKPETVPQSVVQRIGAFLADPPSGWSAEDRIFLIRALVRLDLLTAWAFHAQLSRLFAERRMEFLRSLIDDGSLGFDLVRDFHRLRLSSYLNDNSFTLVEWDDLRRRAKGTFLEAPAYNEFLVVAVRFGAVDEIEREVLEVDESPQIRIADDVVFGGSRLLMANGRHRAAALLLERHIAPLDEEQRLRFLEPLFRLDEKGALSPPLSEFCASFRPDIGRATVKRLAQAYVAVDSLDRAQFNRFIIDPLLALQDIKPNFMDVRFSAEERRGLVDAILRRLAGKEPLSLIRLGDGEAYALPTLTVEGIERKGPEDDNALRERHWWGIAPPADIANEIKRAVRRSIETCDIIGLPSVFRVLRVIARPKIRFGESHQQRGLMTVLAACGSAIPLEGKFVTEERCHHCALDRSALDAMIAAAESVVIVSCWPEHRLRFASGPAKHILVPPPQRVKHLTESAEGEPIFESYREIAAKVRAESGPGTLVLVGAGVVGKIFVEEAKRAGAVALDVGSLLDYLAGHHTRLLADTPALINAHGNSASVSEQLPQ